VRKATRQESKKARRIGEMTVEVQLGRLYAKTKRCSVIQQPHYSGRNNRRRVSDAGLWHKSALKLSTE
jgi:hypothetical protein